ncbi:hypothetical protein LB542_20385 [Mesorhizobium sp. BR1-1-9]|uniref:hypothetical protein n=1 Tax=unclassified Mesorhizobium TaxID=325217 RepID=UPI001CD09083|nr:MULTISPECIES: hypothetical protein [unclassified Mesorhizobium]MBZ9873205.1 hypothetical protein [Mesorhizobium sp. BR1-1-9]MBZ9944984.1 hypothetical protein [Mesorhizobium sp. BR1-1-13]
MFLTDLFILGFGERIGSERDLQVRFRAPQVESPGVAVMTCISCASRDGWSVPDRWRSGTVIGLAIDNEVARSRKARMQAKGNINGYA